MKKILIVFSLLFVIGIMAACGNGSGDKSADAKDESTVLKLGHALPADHTVDKASKRFAELVEEKTEGEVKVEVLPASQLGNEREMLEQLSIGAQDMGVIVSGAHSSLAPEFGITSLVYAFRDIEHAEAIMNGEIGEELTDKLLEQHNIRVIDPFWYYGTRHLTANDKITTPEELKGKKIRVPELEIQVEGLKAMGADATPVDFNELYMALETGVVNGEENPATTIRSSAFNEVQDYLMLTGHITSNFMISISDPVFQELTEEQQEHLIESAKEAGLYNNEITVEEEEEALKELEESGMEFVEVDKEEFSKAGKEVADQHKDDWGDLYERIQKVE